MEKDYSEIQIPEPANVRVLIETLSGTMNIWNVNTNDVLSFSRRPDMLILINDVEIGLLGGLEAPLSEGDLVTLIPTAHGG